MLRARLNAQTNTLPRAAAITQKADKKRIYVVRANGDVVTGGRSGWFRRIAIVRDAIRAIPSSCRSTRSG